MAITQTDIDNFASALGIQNGRDVNQSRIVKLTNGNYATSISIKDQTGWHIIPSTEHSSRSEAEALGAEFLYNDEAGQAVRNNAADIAATTQVHDTGVVLGKPSDDDEAPTDRSELYENGTITGQDDA